VSFEESNMFSFEASMEESYVWFFWPIRSLGFQGSKSKLNMLLAFTSVLTTLWHCHLQVQKINQILMMVIYWPNAPQLNCTNTFKFVITFDFFCIMHMIDFNCCDVARLIVYV
jgi:hypothetical protein